MRQSNSPPGIKIKPYVYEQFVGLNTERHHSALDTGKNQYLAGLRDAFCDRQGQIVREPSARWLESDEYISNVWQISGDSYVYAEHLSGGVTLRSNAGHLREEAFAVGSVMSGAIFSRNLYIASFGQPVKYYDGSLFRELGAPSLQTDPPAFLTSVNRRIACAGMARYPMRVWLSRVDMDDVFPNDEDPNDTNVLRAGSIDISNMSNSGDVITGIAGFEWNRLAIFTNNQTLLYQVDPNVENWSIQDQTAIDVGCVSHNTIVNSGSELLFCSSEGVHALRRSRYNNISVYSINLSDDVLMLYRELYETVSAKQRINAAWDSETRRLHIFFPYSRIESHRLSVYVPKEDDEIPRWSYGRYLNATCAFNLADRFLIGTPGGVFERYKVGQVATFGVDLTMEIVTPMFWLGSMSRNKTVYSLLVHCVGTGQLTITVMDDQDAVVATEVVEIDDNRVGDKLPGIPLMHQFERKLDRSLLGMQLKLESTGTDLLRINGLAVNIRE